jgi:hypothetical protein
MTKPMKFSVLMLVVGLLVLGCKHKPQMTAADVIQVANQAAQNAGYKLTDYEAPNISFELTKRNHKWHVHYEGKAEENLAIPGSDFSIVVDDRTRKTELVRGL